MKLLKYIAVCGLLLAAPCAWGQSISFTCNEWRPYVDPAAKGYGMVTEIVAQVFARAGFSMSATFLPWPRALRAVTEGEIETTVAWQNAERERKFIFSEPFMINKFSFLKLRNRSITWNTLEDLRGYTFAVMKEASYDPEFDNAPFLKKIYVYRANVAIKMVMAGRVDMAPRDLGAAHYLLSEYPAEEARLVDFVDKPLSERPMHLIVSRKLAKHKEIIDAFNKGLAELRGDGTYDRILKRYGLSSLCCPSAKDSEGGTAKFREKVLPEKKQ